MLGPDYIWRLQWIVGPLSGVKVQVAVFVLFNLAIFMSNNYLDRSNYVKSLLLMIGKDKKVTDKERGFLHDVAKKLSFNKCSLNGQLMNCLRMNI
jgi:hypothetical protein